MFDFANYPRSHGEIRLRSAIRRRAPAIDPRYFSDPEDLYASPMRRSCRGSSAATRTRRIMKCADLALESA